MPSMRLTARSQHDLTGRLHKIAVQIALQKDR
jgi:hypothetical protein